MNNREVQSARSILNPVSGKKATSGVVLHFTLQHLKKLAVLQVWCVWDANDEKATTMKGTGVSALKGFYCVYELFKQDFFTTGVINKNLFIVASSQVYISYI